MVKQENNKKEEKDQTKIKRTFILLLSKKVLSTLTNIWKQEKRRIITIQEKSNVNKLLEHIKSSNPTPLSLSLFTSKETNFPFFSLAE